MTPVRISDRGFYDGAEHRLELVSAYNQYTRCSTDPAWSAAHEHLQSLFRPLFLTSFMLADYLRDNRFFGAERIVVSSASAKTAYGTAFCLTDDAGIETIALTSEGNKDFVADLGCYGSIVAYADLADIAADRPTLYVDFSGDGGLRARVHAHFGRTLVYDCYAGSAQSTEFLGKVDLPGPEPKFYFAPHHIRKRNADWGAAEVTRRAGEAQRLFMDHLNMPGSRRLEIELGKGIEAARAVVADLASGRTDPRKGHIIEMT